MDNDQRLLNAINELVLAPKGSLWFIRENIWAEMIPDYIIKRKAHPALVFANKKYNSLKDTVPVMLGSSRDLKYRRGFQVRDVMPLSTKKTTYFTAIRPCLVRPVADGGMTIENFTGGNPSVKRNFAKPNLEPDEMERLDGYLRNRGLSL